ncbi:hypothetical protein AeMF1_014860 [Aphanomyces euteiches]|nr:hypothetical protein AeMF1_014860 [Aphanomyces euteiches]KAH9187927.1 hypothetical protein AeNC1_010095 [Aphanomyces euteiches]
MWGYAFHGGSSRFLERHRVLFSLSNMDADRKNLGIALRRGARGLFISSPDDSTQLAAARTVLRDVLPTTPRHEIRVVVQCSSTWTLNTMIERSKEVATKTGLDYIDAVLYPAALLSPEVQGKAQIQELVAIWAAMTGLVDAGAARHIGVCDFQVHQLEILFHRFPTRPIEIYCFKSVTPFMPMVHTTHFCHTKGIDVIACLAVDLETLSFKEKEEWKALATSIAVSHQKVHVVCNLPSETIRGDTHAVAINQTTVQHDVNSEFPRTHFEVQAAWLTQRGLIAVPSVEGDEPYEDGMCDALFSLCHPFSREPTAAAPTNPHQFILSNEEMARINGLSSQ